jgi:hypothetical protein
LTLTLMCALFMSRWARSSLANTPLRSSPDPRYLACAMNCERLPTARLR